MLIVFWLWPWLYELSAHSCISLFEHESPFVLQHCIIHIIFVLEDTNIVYLYTALHAQFVFALIPVMELAATWWPAKPPTWYCFFFGLSAKFFISCVLDWLLTLSAVCTLFWLVAFPMLVLSQSSYWKQSSLDKYDAKEESSIYPHLCPLS